jgi:hypothetical protein
MTTRDLATIAFKALAAWLFASGVAGMCSALLTWSHSVGQYGKEGSVLGLAAAAIYIPIGAVWWAASDRVAKRVFPGRAEPVALALTRADLYGFASVLVGLCLLADAVPMIVYWLVIWAFAHGTGFWSAASPGTTDDGIVYWVAARAGVGSVAAKTILGLILLGGPERVKRGLQRLRREFSGHLEEPGTKKPDEARE